MEDSQTNYPRTLHALAASLNLDYLDGIAAAQGAEQTDTSRLVDHLQHHALGRFLKDHGYTYAHVGAWWDPTETNPLADVNPVAERTSDFSATLLDTTIVPDLAGRLRRLGVPLPAAATDIERRHYRAALLFAFDRLDAFAALPGATFVFAHILLPHDPYVFDRSGRFVAREDRIGRPTNELFAEQLAYTDARIIAFLERILAVPEAERPIVVLQADEGPNPPRYHGNHQTFPWLEATPAELDEKFGILNAYHLAGAEAPEPWRGISPVNSFRLILSAYFGADLPALPDRHFVFRDGGHPYDLIDVTDRVRPLAGG